MNSSYSTKRYRFSNKERDDETGLYYFGVRYYAAWLGRWTSSDPADFIDGLNLYRYVRNNPVNLVDADGRSSERVEGNNSRFGFNGMEKDAEISNGNYTTHFRALDTRIGRWLSTDPVTHEYLSPYNAMDDNPVWGIDPMGGNTESVDDIYVFGSDGIFTGEIIEAEGPDVGLIRNYVDSGEDFTFEFVDPNYAELIVTPEQIESGNLPRQFEFGIFYLDRVEITGKFDIKQQLMNGNVFDDNGIPNLIRLYTDSRGFDAPLDFSAKNYLLDRTSTLFVIESYEDVEQRQSIGHDFRNYGNFLWGATNGTWGVPDSLTKAGSNGDARWNTGEWDSTDDQRSIFLGKRYAEKMNWKRISYK